MMASDLTSLDLIHALMHKSAYPASSVQDKNDIELKQTHLSMVFLVGKYVYKLKKNVNLGFVDYSTLEKRKDMCEREVRLNLRMAPSVYLGVVCVCRDSKGVIFVDERDEAPHAEIIDYAVKMLRLPDEQSLDSLVAHGKVGSRQVELVARQLAHLHQHCEKSEEPKRDGFATFSLNIVENFEQTLNQVGSQGTILQPLYDALKTASLQGLERFHDLILERESQGKIRDCHGDLRMEHIYFLGSDNNINMIDCIEFNDRFRYSDTLLDASFLYMDMLYQGYAELASVFMNAYLEATNELECKDVFLFYAAYRSIVRAKVAGIKALDEKIPQQEREAAVQRSIRHWMIAASWLLPQRPTLILVRGLPGTGKSTVSRIIQQELGQARCCWVRSDCVRKELASNDIPLYSPEMTRLTYDACYERAKQHLLLGQVVLLDATFNDVARVQKFQCLAKTWNLLFYIVECQCDRSIIKERLAHRINDVSDADWSVYEAMEAKWLDLDKALNGQWTRHLNTSGSLLDIQEHVKNDLKLQ